MAESSSSSATMSRTRCAACPSGTNSCTEGGSSQASSTFHARKCFVMPPSESPPEPHVEPLQPLPGRAPSTAVSDLAKMLCNQRLGLHPQNSPKPLIALNFGLESDTTVLPSWRSLAGTSWLREAGGMTPEPVTYPGYRFPAAIIDWKS